MSDANLDIKELIAKYGDSANTVWTDPQYNIFRHEPSGGAVGWLKSKDFAIAWGNPLGAPEHISAICRAWIDEIQKQGLKPLWTCVDDGVEKVLAGELEWSAVRCAAEDQLDPTQTNPETDKGVRRKIHKAQGEGVVVQEDKNGPSEDLRKQAEEGMVAWKKNRTGQQIHTTTLLPFDDAEHRRYFYAQGPEGKVVGLLVLAKVKEGWVIKWCLQFPNAPVGTSEILISHVIKQLGEEGEKYLTFGVGAQNSVKAVDNLKSFRFEFLSKTYTGIAHSFGLTKKTDYRRKFNIEENPVYVCYPQGGLGMDGINALMNVLKRDE